MRQTILVVAALMLVLSAAAFAVAPVHALGATCPGLQYGVNGADVSIAGQAGGVQRGAFDPSASCPTYSDNFPGYPRISP
jgi:hypothetical protein